MIRHVCGGCEAELPLPDAAAGLTVRCPHCRCDVAVPAPAAPPKSFAAWELLLCLFGSVGAMTNFFVCGLLFAGARRPNDADGVTSLACLLILPAVWVGCVCFAAYRGVEKRLPALAVILGAPLLLALLAGLPLALCGAITGGAPEIGLFGAVPGFGAEVGLSVARIARVLRDRS